MSNFVGEDSSSVVVAEATVTDVIVKEKVIADRIYAGPTIDTVKRKFGSAARVAILSKSYADPLVKLSGAAAINDRTSHLAEILEDYAWNHRIANPKDQDKVNMAVIKLFHKMTMSQDPSTSAKDLYYTCVNDSTIRDFDVTPELIYERLLRSTYLGHHPQGISSLAFAFAAILALTLHREDTSQSDLKNETSPYFDLSPLYGANGAETDSIRMKDGRGMLYPDTFTEKRLDMLPGSVPALLVLWNRYHNYVAKQLLSYNEGNQWKDRDLSSEQFLTQDNEIFDLARSITCIHFMNVVKEDFLKGLIGMPMAGPRAQVDILYDVRGMKNDKAGYLSSVESYLLYSFSSFAPPSFASEVYQRVKCGKGASIGSDAKLRNIGNLRRNDDNRFEDNDLADLLFNAAETMAGSPGAKAVPEWAREQEILKLKQARQANVCTLNEFRQYLGLEPLKSFEEWNSELAGTARDLYGDVDKLELYPGLICECPNGSGFGFGYTMTWGLIADISSLRPIITSRFKEPVLTKWGFRDCSPSVDNVNDPESSFDNANGCFGAMLPKLFLRTLPHNCAYNNIYCLFPFIVPEKSKKQIEKLQDHIQKKKYSVERPKQTKIKVLRTLEAISQVLNRPENFPTPYKQNLREVTGGYGHMLGFDDLTLHDRDLMMLLSSLIPDKGALKRIGAAFAQKAQENLERRSFLEGDIASVDIVKDVIDATCIQWVCETIFNVRCKDSDVPRTSRSKVGSKEVLPESRKMEARERKNFAAYYAYIFRNTEPEFGWNVRERALTASKHVSKRIKGLLNKDKPRNLTVRLIYKSFDVVLNLEQYRWLHKWCLMGLVGDPYSSGKMAFQYPAFTFLDRKAWRKRWKKQSLSAYPNARQTSWTDGLALLIFPPDNFSVTTEHEIDEYVKKKAEEQRVIANAIGLAVMISVHMSKGEKKYEEHIILVDFYLEDKYTEERKALVSLCKEENSTSSKKIIEYVREAQRIGHRFGLWRDVVLKDIMEFDQGHGHPAVSIQEGDSVYLDFTSAHNDPKQFPVPEKVVPGREINSLRGLGFHMCPAGSFIDQTISQMIRAIFRLEGLKRSSKKGHLKSTTLHHNPEPWYPEVYIDENGGFSYYPDEMVLEFKVKKDLEPREDRFDNGDSVEERKEKKLEWNRIEKRYDEWNRFMDKGWAVLCFVLWWSFLLYFLMPLSLRNLFFTLPPSSGITNTECGQPLTIIEDWHIQAFHPKWFGLFGDPAPIVYRTPKGHKAHRITVVDIDQRDIEIHMWVDNEDRGHVPIDLDSAVDCGDDIYKCLQLGFGSAQIDVPPGEHTVKAMIRKGHKSDAFVWGEKRERRVVWKAEQCS
ncbi:hypothetical protein F5887DRAFT_1085399 [Amanita rubescens]|nr:hypothetical protein F5887DRAFT_1085399 [Amanita rubescens]